MPNLYGRYRSAATRESMRPVLQDDDNLVNTEGKPEAPRYNLYAEWYNGHCGDAMMKDFKTKKQLYGALKTVIFEIRPRTIIITDKGQHEVPDECTMPGAHIDNGDDENEEL